MLRGIDKWSLATCCSSFFVIAAQSAHEPLGSSIRPPSEYGTRCSTVKFSVAPQKMHALLGRRILRGGAIGSYLPMINTSIIEDFCGIWAIRVHAVVLRRHLDLCTRTHTPNEFFGLFADIPSRTNTGMCPTSGGRSNVGSGRFMGQHLPPNFYGQRWQTRSPGGMRGGPWPQWGRESPRRGARPGGAFAP
jgi:hypothetical protein